MREFGLDAADQDHVGCHSDRGARWRNLRGWRCGGGLLIPSPGKCQIYNALHSAKTWGEYRRLLPEGEWEERAEMYPVMSEDGKPLMRDGAPVLEYEEGQDDDDPFDADSVPGVGDGDYPTWLQQSMIDWLPEPILEKYGRYYDTRLNGDSVEFDSADRDAIVEELRALGHTVTESTYELV